MGRAKLEPTTGSPPPVSPKDIELACHALQEIKRQLRRITAVGGAGPNDGLLLAAADDCVEAVLVTNDRAEIVMVNGAAARLTGTSTRELQATTFWDITHPKSQMEFDVLWREFLRAGKQRGIVSLRHKQGTAVEVAYCAEADVLPNFHVTVLRRSTP